MSSIQIEKCAESGCDSGSIQNNYITLLTPTRADSVQLDDQTYDVHVLPHGFVDRDSPSSRSKTPLDLSGNLNGSDCSSHSSPTPVSLLLSRACASTPDARASASFEPRREPMRAEHSALQTDEDSCQSSSERDSACQCSDVGPKGMAGEAHLGHADLTRHRCSVPDILEWIVPRLRGNNPTPDKIYELARSFPNVDAEWNLGMFRYKYAIEVQPCLHTTRRGTRCKHVPLPDATTGRICPVCPYHDTLPWTGPRSPFCALLMSGTITLERMIWAVKWWCQMFEDMQCARWKCAGVRQRALWMLLHTLNLKSADVGRGRHCPLGYLCPLLPLGNLTTGPITEDGIFVVRAKGKELNRVHVLCRGRNTACMVLWRSLRQHAEEYHTDPKRCTPVHLFDGGRTRGLRVLRRQFRMCFTLVKNPGFRARDPRELFLIQSAEPLASSEDSSNEAASASTSASASDNDTTRMHTPVQTYKRQRLWQGPEHGRATPWLSRRPVQQDLSPDSKDARS